MTFKRLERESCRCLRRFPIVALAGHDSNIVDVQHMLAAIVELLGEDNFGQFARIESRALRPLVESRESSHRQLQSHPFFCRQSRALREQRDIGEPVAGRIADSHQRRIAGDEFLFGIAPEAQRVPGERQLGADAARPVESQLPVAAGRRLPFQTQAIGRADKPLRIDGKLVLGSAPIHSERSRTLRYENRSRPPRCFRTRRALRRAAFCRALAAQDRAPRTTEAKCSGGEPSNTPQQDAERRARMKALSFPPA